MNNPLLTTIHFSEDEFGALQMAARERAAHHLKHGLEVLKGDTYVLNLEKPTMPVIEKGVGELTERLKKFNQDTDYAMISLALDCPEPLAQDMIDVREYYGMIAGSMVTGLTVDYPMFRIRQMMPRDAADQWLRSLKQA